MRERRAVVSNPDFFTVIEARVLRIGRTAAYEQSKVYRATQGAAGLPVVKMGGRASSPMAASRSRTGTAGLSKKSAPTVRSLSPTPTAAG